MTGYRDTVHTPHGTFALYHSPATLRHVIAGDFSQPTSSSTLPTPPPSTESVGAMEESLIPESSPGSSSAQERHAPGRVLACVQCQTRKLKCNRQFPCARCLKSGMTCVPATAVGKNRKKRFAERELLERLRRYEELLRANNIAFDPLHAERPAEREASVKIKEDPEEHSPFETQDLWKAINQVSRPENEDDDNHSDDHENNVSFPVESIQDRIFYQIWDFSASQDLLFGMGNTSSIDLHTLHPNQVQIFQLWQLYLDNVNPLLRLTHAPSFQARFVQAVSNLAATEPEFEAFLFSIYCIALTTIDDAEALTMFCQARDDMLRTYRFACQQALFKCNFMRTRSVDCLTAMFLYILSVREFADPRATSSHLGAVIRIAQRMKIESETALAKLTPFDAEMRRRLWWAIVMLDERISQMTGTRFSSLSPLWDCRPPAALNDGDLHPEGGAISASPASGPAESSIVFLRAKITNYVRFSAAHLQFTNPGLMRMARESSLTLEGFMQWKEAFEAEHLMGFNLDMPIQFQTIWTARCVLARAHVMEYLIAFSKQGDKIQEAQRVSGIRAALVALEADINLKTSPLTKRWGWMNDLHFQFVAYVLVTQELRRRPMHQLSGEMWETLSTSCEVRWLTGDHMGRSIFATIFAKGLDQAWTARATAALKDGQTLEPPRIVAIVKTALEDQSLIYTPSTTDSSPSQMDLDAMFAPGGMFHFAGDDQAVLAQSQNPFGVDAGIIDPQNLGW